MKNPFEIVKDFEQCVADYTGSSWAVAVDSCTNAIFLCCKYLNVGKVEIPKRTYLSVPMSIIHAGGKVVFNDDDWEGIYQLSPYPIFDAAKRFTSGMYIPETYMCLSFHIKKILAIGKGGMILTDDYEFVKWARKARYEGRSEKNYRDDDIDMLGWNMYMTPEQAARGLTLMLNIPKHNKDMEEYGGYKDLTEFKVFKKDPKC